MNIQTLKQELKEELSFEGIKFGDIDWKLLKHEFIRSFEDCESKEDLTRELKRIIDNFKIPEAIDKIFKKYEDNSPLSRDSVRETRLESIPKVTRLGGKLKAEDTPEEKHKKRVSAAQTSGNHAVNQSKGCGKWYVHTINFPRLKCGYKKQRCLECKGSDSQSCRNGEVWDEYN